jgi:hypothetical protein
MYACPDPTLTFLAINPRRVAAVYLPGEAGEDGNSDKAIFIDFTVNYRGNRAKQDGLQLANATTLEAYA